MDNLIDLTFLSGKDDWVVKYIQANDRSNPKLTVQPINFSYRYTSFQKAVPPNIADVAETLQEQALKKRAFLRGELKQPLENQPRSGATRANRRTRLLFIDADGVEGVESSEDLLFEVLKLPRTHFIEHLSSSSGIKSGLRAHIILLFDDAVLPQAIGEWIWAKCLTTPLLAGQIKLDKSGAVLLPTLDPAACRPSQLFCIADPVFIPPSRDPYYQKDGVEASPNPNPNPNPRWRVVTPDDYKPYLPTQLITNMPDSSLVTEARGEIMALLRVAAGLPKNTRVSTRALSTDRAGNDWTLVTGANPTTVTSARDTGIYTRLNLNGGDSESYWHKTGDPQYIYTFNGWLCYLGAEIAPEYVEKVRQQNLAVQEEEAGALQDRLLTGEVVPFVMLEPQTEQYLCVGAKHDSSWADVLRFTKMSSVQSWLHTNCYLPPFDKLPDVWTPIFDPDKPFIDPVARRINQFTAPCVSSTLTEIPPLLIRLIKHVLGDPPEHKSKSRSKSRSRSSDSLLDLFLTWLAYIYQTRQPAQSAWLFHGVQGTGKDLLFSILEQVFGPPYCTRVMPHLLKEQYTSWAENKSLVFVNEIDSGVFTGTNLASRLNDIITAKYLTIRRMRVDAYTVPNHANLIFAANRMDAVVLPHGDRRYHIPPRQEIPLKSVMTPEEIIELVTLAKGESETIRGVRRWFKEYKLPGVLDAPRNTKAKIVLAKASQPAAVRVSVDLANGSLSSIISKLDTFDSVVEQITLTAAVTLQEGLTGMFAHLQDHPDEWLMTLNEVKIIYAVLCDARVWDHGAVKFAQYAAHNELPYLLETPEVRVRAGIKGHYYQFDGRVDEGPNVLRDELTEKGFNLKPGNAALAHLGSVSRIK